MSRWDEAFLSQPAVQAAQQFIEAAASLETEDAASLEELLRLQKVADLVRATIARVDPELVSAQALSELQGPLANVLSEVQAFKSNRDVGHLTNANANADQVIYALSRWEVPFAPSDLDDLRVRATNYRRSVGQLLRQVEEDAQGVRKELGEVRAALESGRGETDAEIGRAQQRVEEMIATIGQHEARLDQAIARVDEQFSSAEAARAERFENMTDETRKEGATLVQELRTSTSESLKAISVEAQRALDDLHKQEGDARTVAASLGAVGVSGGYGEYAKQQEKQADFWRWIVVTALGLLLVGAFFTLLTLPDDGLEWEHFVTRLFVSGSLIALAGYAANQSAKHRRVEREVRKAEIELASLDPYLALFEPERKNEIKAQILLRMVGHPLAPDGEKDKVGALQLYELLQQVLTKS